MRLAIMQPYLFPYIGYFQLVAVADQFVVYDDVQWMKGGWINRNRIQFRGQERMISLPIQKAAHTSPINSRKLPDDHQVHKAKLLRQCEASYSRSPMYAEMAELVRACVECPSQNASEFIVNSLRLVCEYIGIETPFVLSSSLALASSLHGKERVLEIARIMKATHYINPIGGTDLYDFESFRSQGLELSFLRPILKEYRQGHHNVFIPGLSILDVLAWNSSCEVRELLNEFDLVGARKCYVMESK